MGHPWSVYSIFTIAVIKEIPRPRKRSAKNVCCNWTFLLAVIPILQKTTVIAVDWLLPGDDSGFPLLRVAVFLIFVPTAA
jgi:hypothetical protein